MKVSNPTNSPLTEAVVERWLPVVGYEGIYDVSDQGQVRGRTRVVDAGLGRSRTIHGRILKPIGASTSKRYLAVNLWKDGHTEFVCIHKLVLMAFVGPKPDDMECCHGPGGKTDNRLTNLRWGTRVSNARDKLRDGTDPRRNRTHCPRNHLLVSPNLRRSQLAIGRRQCLACHRAASDIRQALIAGRMPESTFQIASDRHYKEIITATARGSHKERTHCPRGHKLETPNLIPNHGGRSCRACRHGRDAARAARKRNRIINIQSAADKHYQRIMANATVVEQEHAPGCGCAQTQGMQPNPLQEAGPS